MKELKIKPRYKIGDIIGVSISLHHQILEFPKEGNIFQVKITLAYLENNMWKYQAKTEFLDTTVKNLTEENIYEL